MWYHYETLYLVCTRFSLVSIVLSHLRIFGSEVMVHVPKEKRRKWDAIADRCIFSEYSKAYRVYNFKTQDVAVIRDVIFLTEGQVRPREEDPTQEASFEMIVQNEMEIAE